MRLVFFDLRVAGEAEFEAVGRRCSVGVCLRPGLTIVIGDLIRIFCACGQPCDRSLTDHLSGVGVLVSIYLCGGRKFTYGCIYRHATEFYLCLFCPIRRIPVQVHGSAGLPRLESQVFYRVAAICGRCLECICACGWRGCSLLCTFCSFFRNGLVCFGCFHIHAFGFRRVLCGAAVFRCLRICLGGLRVRGDGLVCLDIFLGQDGYRSALCAEHGGCQRDGGAFVPFSSHRIFPSFFGYKISRVTIQDEY